MPEIASKRNGTNDPFTYWGSMEEIKKDAAPAVSEEQQYINSVIDAVTKTATENATKAATENLAKAFNNRLTVPAQPKEHDGNLNEWLCAVANTSTQDHRREKAFNLLNNKYSQEKLQKANNNQTTTTAGGFLVPVEYNRELFRVADLPNGLYARVRKFNMMGSTLNVPIYDQTVTPSAGSNAFNAGYSIAYVAEASANSTNTVAAFKQLQIVAKKLFAITQVSQELIDNSDPAVLDIVQTALPKALYDKLEYDIINGATNELTGIIGDASVKKVFRNTLNTIKYSDLCDMVQAFTGGNGVWIINKTAQSKLYQLATTLGANMWLEGQNVSGGNPGNLLGYPYIFSQYNPVLGSEGDVMLVDADCYFLGENKSAMIEASRDFAFSSDLVTLRLIWRGGGKPAITAPIKLADGTQTVSPFVVLDDVIS